MDPLDQVYLIEGHLLAQLERLNRDLYGYGETLTADRRRDLASRLNLFLRDARSAPLTPAEVAHLNNKEVS